MSVNGERSSATINTAVRICGVDFKNPVIGASGTFGFGSEFEPFMDVNHMGGIACKGLTLNERYGNEGARLCETPSGLINSIGLQNPGVKFFKENIMPRMKKYDTVIIANLGGATEEEYLEGVKVLNQTDIDFIELNISCPNVKHGGMALGIKSETAFDIVKKVKAICEKPLIVKLSPNAENIVEMALACERAGADALSLVNTFKAMAIDIYKRKPVFDNVFAGLSGPAIKPIALRMVYEVCKNVQIPVIGIGGISSYKDAVEFIMAGASAVQVGAANFVRPGVCDEIIDGIEKFMKENDYVSIDDFKGII